MDNILGYIIDTKALELLAHFTTIFGVRIAFFSKQGNEIAVGKNAPLCKYCRLIRTRLRLGASCLACDEHYRRKSVDTKQLVSYDCHAGLLEAIYPVYVYDHLIGFIMMGQCRTHKSLKPEIHAVWRKKFGASRQMQKAFLQVPYFTAGQAQSILQFFTLLVQYVIANNLVNVKNNLTIDSIADYVKKNLHKPISLQEAAAIGGRSPTTITHLVKKVTGNSFKRMCLDIKLDEAEKLLKSIPGLTVAEAAQRTGFDDQFYFSRIFKKYKSRYPSYYKIKSQPPAVEA